MTHTEEAAVDVLVVAATAGRVAYSSSMTSLKKKHRR